MNTHEIIQQIRSCESMCKAGKAATAYFLEVCRSDPSHVPSTKDFRVRDIRAIMIWNVPIWFGCLSSSR